MILIVEVLSINRLEKLDWREASPRRIYLVMYLVMVGIQLII